MNEKGYTNASALLGGTAAWKNAGFPMESSEEKKDEQTKEKAGDVKK